MTPYWVHIVCLSPRPLRITKSPGCARSSAWRIAALRSGWKCACLDIPARIWAQMSFTGSVRGSSAVKMTTSARDAASPSWGRRLRSRSPGAPKTRIFRFSPSPLAASSRLSTCSGVAALSMSTPTSLGRRSSSIRPATPTVWGKMSAIVCKVSPALKPQANAAKALYRPNPPGMGRRIRQMS